MSTDSIFMNLVKENGMEELATQSGLVKDGKLSNDLRSAGAVGGKRPAPASLGLSKKKKRVQRSPSATGKASKGLRHFSSKVCQKVKAKQKTTYNEVADELVREFASNFASTGLDEQSYDEKNIRRRVYDALNVLMAMDIITKEKKEIRWKGLPTNADHDLNSLQREKEALLKSIEKKKAHLQQLVLQVRYPFLLLSPKHFV